jgi:dehydrogenase/reductase SDR family member 12
VQVDKHEESVDGHELNFATNTLGTFALTHLLQPSLERSGQGSRVITVTSGGAYTAPLVTDDLQMAQLVPFDGMLQYARDKRRQIAMMERFAARFAQGGMAVGCYLMHPGWADTGGVRTSMPSFHKTMQRQLRTLAQGVDTVLWLSLMDTAGLEAGALYLDRQVQAKHTFMSGTHYTDAQVDALWGALCKLAGIDAGGPEDAVA